MFELAREEQTNIIIWPVGIIQGKATIDVFEWLVAVERGGKIGFGPKEYDWLGCVYGKEREMASRIATCAWPSLYSSRPSMIKQFFLTSNNLSWHNLKRFDKESIDLGLKIFFWKMAGSRSIASSIQDRVWGMDNTNWYDRGCDETIFSISGR